MSPTKQLLRKRFSEMQFLPEDRYCIGNFNNENHNPSSSPYQDFSTFDKESVHDQAALLLSVADIAKSEIKKCPSALEDDEIPCTKSGFPLFPRLGEKADGKWLEPRTESLKGLLVGASTLLDNASKGYPSSRIRAVSIDSPVPMKTLMRPLTPPSVDRASTPVNMQEQTMITPISSPMTRRVLPLRKQSLRLSVKARHERVTAEKSPISSVVLVSPKTANKTSAFHANNSNKQLQSEPRKGVPVKRIMRRKFSWKNYPELEQFLIANREEYLRHSALNYTLQQKQYNNRLTEELLELATEHGYLFDTTEFSFVTVRDRIRCYYKSFVQSAKKRGVLMGYAARKAGLLTEDDLEKSACQAGKIVTPQH